MIASLEIDERVLRFIHGVGSRSTHVTIPTRTPTPMFIGWTSVAMKLRTLLKTSCIESDVATTKTKSITRLPQSVAAYEQIFNHTPQIIRQPEQHKLRRLHLDLLFWFSKRQRLRLIWTSCATTNTKNSKYTNGLSQNVHRHSLRQKFFCW